MFEVKIWKNIFILIKGESFGSISFLDVECEEINTTSWVKEWIAILSKPTNQ